MPESGEVASLIEFMTLSELLSSMLMPEPSAEPKQLFKLLLLGMGHIAIQIRLVLLLYTSLNICNRLGKVLGGYGPGVHCIYE